jgi:hypothetical protein
MLFVGARHSDCSSLIERSGSVSRNAGAGVFGDRGQSERRVTAGATSRAGNSLLGIMDHVRGETVASRGRGVWQGMAVVRGDD